MIAPFGGFLACGISGGRGVSALTFRRVRIAVPGANRWTDALATTGVSWRSGEMSSSTQMPRP